MDKSNTYVAIMAGGIGSRFWPASRVARPKQFMDILGVGKSLIRLTFERFLKIAPAENIFIVTNGMYKRLCLEHIPELTENQILCEPSRNNTAPCVAYTAFKLHALNEDANFIIAPSDHVVLKEDIFTLALEKALDFTAREDALCTLGIRPSRPDTGYGYINYDQQNIEGPHENDNIGGVHKVIQFTEKPDQNKAKEFIASGDYLWNAGIFIWRAKSILESFRENAVEIYDILGRDKSVYNTAEEQTFIDQHYPTTPKISVDYAIMEKAKNVYTIPVDFGWSDLGTWASLHAESDQDEYGNVLQGGNIQIDDVTNSLVRVPQNKLVVLRDIDNYIIVDEEDVLIIYPKSKEQEIKAVTKGLEADGKGDYL
jgi:mannose-1-phosphate guanylyltransferase